MNHLELRTKLLLCVQRALLGKIYKKMRSITIGFDDIKKLKIIVYLEEECNEDDIQNLEEITAEILADIDFEDIEEQCIYSKESLSELKCLDVWVYYRKE
jgi:hypothetical protein